MWRASYPEVRSRCGGGGRRLAPPPRATLAAGGSLLRSALGAAASFLALWGAQVLAAWLCVGWSAIGVLYAPGSGTVLLGPAEFAAWALVDGFAPTAVGTLGLLAIAVAVRGRGLRVAAGWPVWTLALAAGSLETTITVYRGDPSGGTWSPLDHVVGSLLPAAPALVALAAAGAAVTAFALPVRGPRVGHPGAS
jgi:hypothetical protein